ncbi:cytochrome P450 [Gulosibacter chungangensis]|uniref:Cytochrome P450 n=1 Tax=Gulosibacter chungangensis TaxID=979746 RepID=A0A7J5BHL3_9MICO|nr:cytochrome P450 [Gulosibacter chungangensis]KAB1644909.1 cytochrome P450 [Gulosibacter chungangensis]
MTISIDSAATDTDYTPLYDPFTAEFQADPFSYYKRLRDEAPVYHNEKWDFYAISRYEDVRAVLKDHERFLNYEGVDIDDFEQEQRGPGILPDLDNPRHDQLRTVVQRSFMPRSIRKLTDQIREVCDGFIDNFADRSEVDLADEFAWPIPFQVFFDFLGMPQGEIRERFVEWTHGIKDREVGSPDLTPFARKSTDELREYLKELLYERRANPREDVLTTIVQAEIDGEPLAPEDFDAAAEVVGLVFALYIAGIETTAGQIATTFEQLALHPDQQQALRENPKLIPQAVEESLRFRSIFQVTARTTATDVEMHGVRIPAGKRVFLVLGAANRDERQFDDPDTFNIHRTQAPHLAFGEGLHGCLGNPLARLEATVALEQILSRKSPFVPNGEPRRYTTTPNAYVFDRVPVRFE